MKFKRLTKLMFCLPLVFLVASPLLALEATKADYQEKLEKTYPLSPEGKVVLRNVSGDIEVTSWDRSEVKIIAIKYSKAATKERAKENADKVEIKITPSKNLIRIDTDYPKLKGIFSRSFRVWVDYRLFVPGDCSLDIHTVSGDVDTAGVMGGLILESVSGDITVDKGGEVDAQSVSGDLKLSNVKEVDVETVSGDAEVTDMIGELRVSTVSGDLVCRKVAGDIWVNSVSGEIELEDVDNCRKLRAGSTSGEVDFEGQLMSGGSYSFHTTSGDITVILPADSSFELEANTFSGSISCSFSIEVKVKKGTRKLAGTAGKGDASLRISSTSGDIDIEKK